MSREDLWARARQATVEMEYHLSAIAQLADERALAVQELLDRGLTRSEVARRLGVTPAAITKILKRPVVAHVSHVGQDRGRADIRNPAKREVKSQSGARQY